MKRLLVAGMRSSQRLVLGATVAVVLLGLGLWALVAHHRADNQTVPVVVAAMQVAESQYAAGEYQRAYDTLQPQIAQAQGVAQKARMYDDLAAAASALGKLPQAIQYYNLKHQFDPKSAGADAALLGELYARSDQTAQAVAQYRKALVYTQSLPQSAQRDARIQSLQAIVTDLEATHD